MAFVGIAIGAATAIAGVATSAAIAGGIGAIGGGLAALGGAATIGAVGGAIGLGVTALTGGSEHVQGLLKGDLVQAVTGQEAGTGTGAATTTPPTIPTPVTPEVAAAEKRARVAAAALGRGSTINTTPGSTLSGSGGLTGDAPVTKKTLLGQ